MCVHVRARACVRACVRVQQGEEVRVRKNAGIARMHAWTGARTSGRKQDVVLLQDVPEELDGKLLAAGGSSRGSKASCYYFQSIAWLQRLWQVCGWRSPPECLITLRPHSNAGLRLVQP